MALALDRSKIIQDAVRAGWMNPAYIASPLGQVGKLSKSDLEHFLFSQRFRSSPPSKLFDPIAYQEAYPDVAEYPFHPLVHYLFHGQEEGRQAFPVFEPVAVQGAPEALALWVAMNAFSITGAPMAALDLYKGLWRRLGRAPQSVGSPHSGALEAEWKQLGAAVHAHGLSFLRGKSEAQVDALIFSHKSLFLNCKTSFIHVHSAFCYAEVLAAKALDIPVLLTIHEPNPDEANAFEAAYIAQAIAAANMLVFVSQDSADTWAAAFNIDAQKMRVIPKAIMPVSVNRRATRADLKFTDQEFVALNVGTVCDRKGQADVIAALEDWPDAPKPNFRLVMVGFNGTDYAQNLLSRINNLISKGWKIDTFPESKVMEDRNQVEKLFSAADVFLMTSRAESRPLVVSEALAHGCPVICADVEGIEEMIVPGEDGVLYQPGNAKNLRDILSRMADAPAQMAAMRDVIAQKQKQDGFDRMLDHYITLFESWAPGLLDLNAPHFKVQ